MKAEKINFDSLTAEQIGKLFPIRIVPYNPDWKILFEKEKALITEVLGEKMALGVEHIGSTSIVGLAAKPTIDMMVEVSKLSDELKLYITRKLETIGYGNMYNSEKDNKMTFGKGYNESCACVNAEELTSGKVAAEQNDKSYVCTQTYHVHIREKGDAPQDEIYFRDYLRRNADVCDEYARLKYALAEKHRFNREDYTQAKTGFIRNCLKFLGLGA
jgi:Uncharacterized conserved protein